MAVAFSLPVAAAEDRPGEAPAVASGLSSDSAPTKAPQPRKRKKRRPREGLDVRGTVGVMAGGLTGLQYRPEPGALAELTTDLELRWRAGDLRLSVPVGARHRQTFGASLAETRADAAVEVEWRFFRGLRGRASAGVRGAWRPQWNDLYQPLGTGGLAQTSRYSYLEPVATTSLRYSRWSSHAFTLRYDFRRPDYLDDPNFNPVDEPTHLVPSDHTRHQVAAAWRWDLGNAEVGARVEGLARFDRFLIARDALTGRTHAGAGGPPSNPLQVTYGVEPGVHAQVRLARFVLRADYGYEASIDAFEGYYSFAGHHPKVSVRYEGSRGTRVALNVEAWLRTYGPDSYAVGPGHPPLDFGSRRVDHKIAASLEGRLRIAPRLYATMAAAGVLRETNFPDYRPFVFPSRRGYDVDWDYLNLRAAVGAEYRF